MADIDRVFAQVWDMAGGQIPAGELVSRDDIAPAGDTAVRLLASVPKTAGLYRLGQLVAAFAAEVQAVSVSGLRRRVATARDLLKLASVGHTSARIAISPNCVGRIDRMELLRNRREQQRSGRIARPSRDAALEAGALVQPKKARQHLSVQNPGGLPDS